MLHSPIAESKQPTALPTHAGGSLRASRLGASLTASLGAGRLRPCVGTLQSTMGNQAVLRMMSRSAPTLQTKLTVNQPGDPFEREADRVADRVMRMGEPKVQRKCAACEEEEKAEVHRKETNSGPAIAPASVHDVLNSPGQPLNPASRAFFERRFGADLSGVRIHDSAQAAASAHAVGALGYTVGQHIAFAGGQYQPGTDSGRRLLAHELAHTFQQRGASPNSGPLPVSSATGPHEQAADRMATEALARPALQRQALGDFKFDPCITAPVVGEVCGQKAADVCKKISLPGCGVVCKVFDCRKAPEPKNMCPPGFHPGGSKEFQGQCCKETAASENERDCCSAERVNMFGACCPVGQVPQGMRCVTPPSEPLPIPDLCPPERKTLFGKCCIPPQIPGAIDCMDPAPLNPPPGKPAATPATPMMVASPVYFNLDRPHVGEGNSALNSCVTGEGATNLKALVALLKANPAMKVQLVGRASPEGDFKYNLDLGARRAQMVADALTSAGIGAAQIADAPGASAAGGCQPIGTGRSTCGEIGSSGERDRQVFPTVFATAPPATP